MISLKRRSLLGGAAAFAVPTSVVALPVAPMSAQERYAFHLAELRKAAEEINPMIGHWSICGFDKDTDGGCSLIITAFRMTGRYEGDGLYEAGKPNWNGSRTRWSVRLLSDRIDDERLFHVSTDMDRMQLTETRLNTFIGRRLA